MTIVKMHRRYYHFIIIIILIYFSKFGDCKNDEIAVHIKRSPFSTIDDSFIIAQNIALKHNLTLVKKIFPHLNYYLFHKNEPRNKRTIDNDIAKKDFMNEPMVDWIETQIPKKRVKRESKHKVEFNDPMWPKLWYINSQERHSNLMRIKEAWQHGYTGKGVVVTILDDGLERDHPDLVKNFDFRASLDINDNDNDPKPRYDRYNYNKHGTRCAGEVAATADNNVCSVGVAYNSRIGGIRMLDGEVTDLVEATALSHNRDYIDIYSASWGPDDDGKTVDGPGHLALKAIEDGVKYGRHGLGSVYVWASGNGGKDYDNCNCDGYTNSIYTISISSTTQHGNVPWYSESCSSTLATTYSSGSYNERQIVTTDLRKSCTEAHTGTSASAPIAAGIIALTLEANPYLTWRDIQHIIVQTSKPHNLTSLDWQINGANKTVSHSFGFGLMDAMAMIEAAKKWQTVPNQRKCIIEANDAYFKKPIMIPKGDYLLMEITSNGCKGTRNELNYVEHVQSVITIQSSSRGGLAIYLVSPVGTSSILLDIREHDQSTESFNKWPFTSVHMWGESPNGKWTLKIKNEAENTTFFNWNLVFYGTKENPYKQRSTTKTNLFSNNSNARNLKFKKTLNLTFATDEALIKTTIPSNIRDYLTFELFTKNSGLSLYINNLYIIFTLFFHFKIYIC